MFHILRRPTSATLIQRQLAEADADFLDACKQAEYWTAQTDMLARRRTRLQGYLSAPLPDVRDAGGSPQDAG